MEKNYHRNSSPTQSTHQFASTTSSALEEQQQLNQEIPQYQDKQQATDYSFEPQPPISAQQVKKSFGTCALSVLGLMVVGIIFAGIVEYLLPYNIIGGELRAFLIYACIYIPGLPVMIYIVKKAPRPLYHLPPPKSISFKTMIKVVLINNSVLVFMILFTSMMSVASVQPEPADNYIGSVANDPFTGFFSLVIFAPLIEEFVIRRNFYPHLYQYGARPFVIFSTVIFSFMHLNSGQLLTTIPMGVLAGILMYYSGNFKYAVILHAVSNLASYLLFVMIADAALLTVYLLVQVSLMLIGIIVAIVWWFKELRHKQLAPAQVSFASGFNVTKAAFLNKGSIFCLLGFGMMILFNM